MHLFFSKDESIKGKTDIKSEETAVRRKEENEKTKPEPNTSPSDSASTVSHPALLLASVTDKNNDNPNSKSEIKKEPDKSTLAADLAVSSAFTKVEKSDTGKPANASLSGYTDSFCSPVRLNNGKIITLRQHSHKLRPARLVEIDEKNNTNERSLDISDFCKLVSLDKKEEFLIISQMRFQRWDANAMIKIEDRDISFNRIKKMMSNAKGDDFIRFPKDKYILMELQSADKQTLEYSIIDTDDGKAVSTIQLSRPNGGCEIRDIALSPDGKYLAFLRYLPMISIYDVSNVHNPKLFKQIETQNSVDSTSYYGKKIEFLKNSETLVFFSDNSETETNCMEIIRVNADTPLLKIYQLSVSSMKFLDNFREDRTDQFFVHIGKREDEYMAVLDLQDIENPCFISKGTESRQNIRISKGVIMTYDWPSINYVFSTVHNSNPKLDIQITESQNWVQLNREFDCSDQNSFSQIEINLDRNRLTGSIKRTIEQFIPSSDVHDSPALQLENHTIVPRP